MKILVIGDFHGKFPVKLRKLVKGVDLVVSVGDFFPWSFRKVFFEKCYKSDLELWEVVGKKKYKEVSLGEIESGKKNVLSKLDGLSVPVITTIGNYDKSGINDQYVSGWGDVGWDWAKKDLLAPVLKKYSNIKRIDYSYEEFRDSVFIGGYGHSSPGQVKSVAYREHRAKLDRLFGKFKGRNAIFVSHNMPYDCELDIIRKGDERVVGMHYGSKMVRRIIDRWQPVLAVGGHFHENQGKCFIGKTLVLNPGAACEGECAIVDFDGKKGKVKKVEFVK